MATIEIEKGELIIRLHGVDKLLAFRSRFSVPLQNISEVVVRPPDAFGKGPIVAWKIAGAYLTDVVAAGYFWVSRGLGNNPKPALERLEAARAELEKLPASERRDSALAHVSQAVEELLLDVKEQGVSLDDEGKGWAFYSFKDPEKTIGFEVDHESVRHVVVEVDGMSPEEAVQRIIEAKGKGATYRTPG